MGKTKKKGITHRFRRPTELAQYLRTKKKSITHRFRRPDELAQHLRRKRVEENFMNDIKKSRRKLEDRSDSALEARSDARDDFSLDHYMNLPRTGKSSRKRRKSKRKKRKPKRKRRKSRRRV